MKKRLSIGLAVFGIVIACVAYAHTNSTVLGRLQVTWPDLGYDPGAGLEGVIHSAIAKMSDNSNARYDEYTAVADSVQTDVTHNFNVAFSELSVLLYTGVGASKVRVQDPAGQGWTIAAGPSALTQISVTTPSSGGPRDFSLITTVDSQVEELDNLSDVDLSTPPEDGQALVYDNGSSTWKPGASGDASFKLQSLGTPSTNDGVFKAGSINLPDGKQLYFAADTTLNLKTDVNTAGVTAPAASTAYYVYLDLEQLPAASNVGDADKQVYAVTTGTSGMVIVLAENPEDVENSRYVHLAAVKTDGSSNYTLFDNLAFREHNEYNLNDQQKVNLLRKSNYDFEQGTRGWTATAGFAVTTTGADVANGNASGSVDFTAITQTLESAAIAVPNGLENKSCLVRFRYRQDAGADADVSITVHNSLDELLITKENLPVTSGWVSIQFGFPCPENESINLRLEAEVADPTIFYIDDVWLGEDDRLSSPTPITDWVDFTPSYSGGFGTLSIVNLEYRRVGDSMEIRGFATTGTVTPDTATLALPLGLTIGGTASGDYISVGSVWRYSSKTSHAVALALNGNTHINFGVWNQAAAFDPTTAVNANAIISSSERFGFTSLVIPIAEWAGSGTQQVTLDTQGWYAQGQFNSANFDLSNSSLSTYTTISDGAVTLDNLNTNVPIGPSCTSTNEGTPGQTTCSSGDEQFGFVVDIPYSMTAQVCFSYAHRILVNASGKVQAAFQVMYRENATQTIIEEGGVAVQSMAANDVEMNLPLHVCGIFKNLPAGKATFNVQYEQLASATITTNKIETDQNGSVGQRSAGFTMFPLTQNFPQAVALVGPDSQIKVDTANGHGSSGTAIRRYSVIRFNEGSCITYADSATDGASFTINCDGTYCATQNDFDNADFIVGVSVNASSLSVPITTVSSEERIVEGYGAANLYASATGCRNLDVGDIVRPHDNGATQGANVRASFTITHMAH